MRPDNVGRDDEFDRGDSYDSIRAAGGYTGPPRYVRKAEITLGDRLARFGGKEILRNAPDMMIRFVLIKILILSWIAHPAPVLLAIAVCICLSNAIKGHSPGDMRFAGLRAILQGVAIVLLCGRWITGFTGGWENNAWWVIRWLPDFLRGWGDIDPVLRALLVDPFAILLSVLWIYDTWFPAKVGAALTGRTVLTGYRAPKANEVPGDKGSIANLLPAMPLLFATLPTTTNDWIYALALGLGGSFVASYLITAVVVDIFCVSRQSVRRRAAHFAKYSDRRYLTIDAIGVLPRLILLCVIGAGAIYVAGKDQWLSLLPLGVLILAGLVFYPRYFGLSWQAVEVFETYPGGQPPRAGVHDVSEVLRKQETRTNLTKFAAYCWVPFVYGCVYHFLPGFPQFDGWGIRWPDLYLINFAFAVAVLCILPGQLVCGVLRACYGPILGKCAERSQR